MFLLLAKVKKLGVRSFVEMEVVPVLWVGGSYEGVVKVLTLGEVSSLLGVWSTEVLFDIVVRGAAIFIRFEIRKERVTIVFMISSIDSAISVL